ncbi:MAG: DNA double-strand break repair nuclease NurA [Halobacteriaceae archaeon]
MTLDPVHRTGIADLARSISNAANEADHRALADEVWATYLDGVAVDGETVIEPVDDRARFAAPLDEVGLQPAAFETVHGLDSGTINPRTFRNGLVVDVAQAAMARVPSDLDVHRARTIVKSVHSNDVRVDLDRDWTTFDDEFGRARIVQVGDLARDQERVVHGLSLYLAESSHALAHIDAVEECLLLDGPVYPKQLVTWAQRHRGLRDLVADEPLVEEVVDNYLTLVDRCLDRGVPLVGFVKNARSTALLRALRSAGASTPWASDLDLFCHVLEQHDGSHRRTDELAWTNWFFSRLGADGAFATGDAGVDRGHEPTAYEVAFFVVYDPRTDVAYKVELPRGFAEDAVVREAVRDHVVREVAAEAGPPTAIGRADDLARIGHDETRALITALEAAFDSPEASTYDDIRWAR